MYPIKFKSLYYDKIWGGRDFELFRNDLPEGMLGESWDIACHNNGMSIVENGEFKGMRFDELINLKGEELLGTAIKTDRFPLLVKLINAKDKLSVQVHPNDDYAIKFENDLGKTEAWYVLEAFEGANLIVGTNGCSKEEFYNAINDGTCENLLNKINVKKGDVFFVKSGLVHAIGEGVVIAEIQQNSDTTYRVFDYNRGREIHVNKAMECIDFSLKGNISTGLTIIKNGYKREVLNICEYFSLEKYSITSSCTEKSDLERFYIFTCVDGEGYIKSLDFELPITKGDSILIPATLGEYTIKGNLALLKSYVPNIEKLKNEILSEVLV
ncbi:MAG: type I phosphomannose isomerase catalytic subunit [Sarcina sp.]